MAVDVRQKVFFQKKQKVYNDLILNDKILFSKTIFHGKLLVKDIESMFNNY